MSKKSNTSINGRLAIIDGIRTPFTKMGTDLARLDAVELGRVVINHLLARTGIDPAIIDHTLIGCVSQPAHAANIARAQPTCAVRVDPGRFFIGFWVFVITAHQKPALADYFAAFVRSKQLTVFGKDAEFLTGAG